MAFPENDTFLTRGASATGNGQKPTKKKPASNVSGLLMLVFLPWLMYTVICTLFTFCFHHYSIIVWGLVILCCMMSILFLVLSSRNPRGPAYTYLGVLCLFACFVATCMGLMIYCTYMHNYFSYSENRTYTDVLPSEPAAAHSDAGTMVFTAESRVDTTKALGYKAGTVYCVAPILDDTQSSSVEYWAVGTDCCSQRADFNCDDAWDPKAKSGVVVLENNCWLPSQHEWYMKAVKQAAAAYNVVSAKEPIFVRWVTDPEKVEADFLQKGAGFLVASAAIYFLVCIILGGTLHMATNAPK